MSTKKQIPSIEVTKTDRARKPTKLLAKMKALLLGLTVNSVPFYFTLILLALSLGDLVVVCFEMCLSVELLRLRLKP